VAYINGSKVAELPAACRTSIAMTPAIFVGNTAAAQLTLTVDYWQVMQLR